MGVKKSAHVVGGGIGGMATAACLAQHGWQTIVHERSGELREVGAGIYLKENSIRVLEDLGCLRKVIEEGSRIKKSAILGRNDQPLLSRDIFGERVYTVLRQHLHKELVAVAEKSDVAIEINSDVKLLSAHDGTIETSRGERYQADLIVGADGQRSTLRRDAGLERSSSLHANGSTRILIPRIDSDATDASAETWRGQKRVLVVPAGEEVTYICASTREDDKVAAGLPFNIDYWSSLFPSLAPVLSRVDPHSAIHHAHGKVRVHKWHVGKLALVGDSVHGQPPNLGQGAGLAIANGASLARHLSEDNDISTALTKWEQSEREITEQIQRWSENWDFFVHNWPHPIEPARSAVIWALANFPPTRRHWGRLYRGVGTAPSVEPRPNVRTAA